MKKYFPLLLIALSYACSPKTESIAYPESDKLPETRPADLVVTSHMDGGMLNHRIDLFISKDSCFYKEDDQGEVTLKKFTLTDEKLDELYRVLKENKFDQIESSVDTLTLDRGGMSIDIYWEHSQKGVSADDSGQSFIKEEWGHQYGAVLRYLDSLVPETSEKK